MGVYIKSIEMPKSCLECRLYNDPWCMAKNRNQWRTAYNRPPKGERQNDCPLIEVPTPHDDLIGRETAKKTVCRALEVNCKNLMNTAVPMLIDYALNNAPTIIEAESPESEGE